MRSVSRAVMVATAVCGAWLGGAAGAAGQARGAQQRVTPPPGATDAPADAERGEAIIDRFARRAGQALGLTPNDARRLRLELQATRVERARIALRVREIRQELARLVGEPAGDQERIAALLDEAMDLEVRAAETLVDEQRRLSEFLTPVQRARVLWLRQRLAAAVDRRNGPGGGS